MADFWTIALSLPPGPDLSRRSVQALQARLDATIISAEPGKIRFDRKIPEAVLCECCQKG